MDLKKLNQIIKSAENICARDGVRFTTKRRDIFNIVLHERKALSAYEIAEKLRQTSKTSAPAMSVYRILEFLEQRKLVHKIASVNKYAICAHITCNHEHDMPRLAVCSNCLKVEELASNTPIKQELLASLDAIDFQLQSQQLELIGLCSNCRRNPHKPKGGC
ncbi:MAG: transcriptional repressor [Zetaproteobacteria bacterium]|nr:transcriptional repressor [Zetaproteobacteria bacterium]